MIAWLLACREPMVPRLEETEVASTFEVRWSTEKEGWGQVQYGPTTDYGYGSAPQDQTRQFQGIIFGVPEGETWHYRVVYRPSEDDTAHEQVSEDFTVTGGAPPPELPVFTSIPSSALDDTLITFPLVDGLGFVVVDTQGRYRWWYLADVEEDTYYSLRAELGRNKESFNYTLSTRGYGRESLFFNLGLDGKKKNRFEVLNGSHDFVETPFGYAAIILDEQTPNQIPIQGDALVEVDKDGNQSQIFSTWDVFDPATTGDDIKWSHANSLDYDAENERYLMGLRNFGSILSIDRQGTLEWGFSGDANTFTLDHEFTAQHQYYLKDNEFTIYGNRWVGEELTSVARFQIDEENRTAQRLWTYNQNFTSSGFGSIDKIPDHYLISWGTEGNIEIITEETQEQVFWLQTGLSIGYASAFQYTSTGLKPAL